MLILIHLIDFLMHSYRTLPLMILSFMLFLLHLYLPSFMMHNLYSYKVFHWGQMLFVILILKDLILMLWILRLQQHSLHLYKLLSPHILHCLIYFQMHSLKIPLMIFLLFNFDHMGLMIMHLHHYHLLIPILPMKFPLFLYHIVVPIHGMEHFILHTLIEVYNARQLLIYILITWPLH